MERYVLSMQFGHYRHILDRMGGVIHHNPSFVLTASYVSVYLIFVYCVAGLGCEFLLAGMWTPGWGEDLSPDMPNPITLVRSFASLLGFSTAGFSLICGCYSTLLKRHFGICLRCSWCVFEAVSSLAIGLDVTVRLANATALWLPTLELMNYRRNVNVEIT